MRKSPIRPQRENGAAPAVAAGASAVGKVGRTAPPKPDSDPSRLAASPIAIEGVVPEIDCGRFPAKASVGDLVAVEADIFAEGHDKIDAAILFRRADEAEWREAPMGFLVNDRWRGAFHVNANARYRYTLIAWRDAFASWRD